MDLRTLTELKELGIEFTQDGFEQFEKCRKFINEKRPDLEENFISRFKYLASRPDEKRHVRIRIFSDFAPLSFYFEVELFDFHLGKYIRDYNGGIIFHGNHDGGGNGGSPTFSVNLESVDGWAIHT